jgi:hypothetical protein
MWHLEAVETVDALAVAIVAADQIKGFQHRTTTTKTSPTTKAATSKATGRRRVKSARKQTMKPSSATFAMMKMSNTVGDPPKPMVWTQIGMLTVGLQIM